MLYKQNYERVFKQYINEFLNFSFTSLRVEKKKLAIPFQYRKKNNNIKKKGKNFEEAEYVNGPSKITNFPANRY